MLLLLLFKAAVVRLPKSHFFEPQASPCARRGLESLMSDRVIRIFLVQLTRRRQYWTFRLQSRSGGL